MKWIKGHGYLIVTAIFAVAVFCLWNFKYPHILCEWEQSSLFIWDSTYVADRLAMPSGWAGLIWAFITQFFFNTSLGAAIMAVLCVLTLGLAFKLLCMLTKRMTPRLRPVCYLIALIPALYVCYLPLHPLGGTEEEMEYDYLIRKSDWVGIVKKSSEKSPLSYACNSAAALAQFETGQMNQQSLVENVPIAKQVLSGRSAAFIMSDVYMRTGLVSLSQRSAFEAMESIENFNKSGRSLTRLVECSLIYGQYELTRKYCAILEQTLFYRDWAQRMKALADHPEQIDSHPTYGSLRKLCEKASDNFFM